jgi:two-component system sensor histidine kinase KdpD
MADYLGAECFAICVLSRREGRRLAGNIEAIEKHLNFARNLHIETRTLEGDDPATSIVDFARRNQITQILVGRPKKSSLVSRLLGTDLVLRIVREAKDTRVTVVAQRRRQHQAAAV